MSARRGVAMPAHGGADDSRKKTLHREQYVKSGSKPLEDYGVIGNLMSAALVSRDGSIDWLCLPRFDSAPCFAALLGGPQHGRWVIAPAGPGSTVTRRYVPDTAVLETTFETETGAATLTDFMPLTEDEENVDVVRIV